MPGPASTVEERSLRKDFRPEGTAVRSPPRQSFQTRFIAICLTVTQQSDGFFQSRNLDSQISCCGNLLLYEEERNLEKWPMTSSDLMRVGWRHLLYYANLHNESSNLDDNQSRIVSLRWTAEMLIDKGQDNRSMAHKTRAGRRTIGEQDRSWDTPWNRGWPV